MTPKFQITANDQDLTTALATRLIRLSIDDEISAQSDQVQIDLDNRDASIILPPFGATLRVSLGYAETGLSEMGAWTVDELELEGPDRLLTIRSRSGNTPAAAVGNSGVIPRLQGNRNDTYVGLTIGEIVAKVAARNNLKAAVDPEIGKIAIPHVAQSNEPDSQFLLNLLATYSAGLKVQGETINVFRHGSGLAPRSNGATAQMTSINLAPTDCLRWRATLTRRSSHSKARAYWHDRNGLDQYVTAAAPGATEEDSETSDPTPHTNEDEATAAATSLVERLDRGSEMLDLTLVGNPIVCCQSALVLSGFDPAIDRPWIAVRVTHTLDRSGYVTHCELEKSLDQAAGYAIRKGLKAKRPGK